MIKHFNFIKKNVICEEFFQIMKNKKYCYCISHFDDGVQAIVLYNAHRNNSDIESV